MRLESTTTPASAIGTASNRAAAVAVTARIRAYQRAALQAAAHAGPDDLLRYARTEQATRDKSADEAIAARTYRLHFLRGYRFAQGVEKVDGSVAYVQDTDPEGVCICMCADQEHVEAVNDALRSARITYRIECKHRKIRFELEREMAGLKRLARAVKRAA